MNRVYKGIILFCFVFITNQISAQELKFGHLNFNEILSQMPELKTVEEQLKGEYDTLESMLTNMQEDLNAMQQKYVNEGPTLSSEEKRNMEQQIGEGQQRVQVFYQKSQQSIQTKEQELRNPIIEKLHNAIQEVGAENGFFYIFEGASGLTVFKSAKSTDIGSLVKAKLGIQ